MGSGRAGASLAGALLAVGLASCTGSGAGTVPPSGSCLEADAQNAVTMSANNLAFSAPCIEAASGEPIVIHFTNQEAIPHDVAVYKDSSKKEELARSDIVTGPSASTTVTVPAQPPGQFYFECTIHGAMNGALVVRGAKASP